MSRTRKLTDDQVKAAEMSLQPGMTHEVIATTLGVHPKTVGKWLRRPDIAAIVEERRAAIEDATREQYAEEADRWTVLGVAAEKALMRILQGDECFRDVDKDGGVFFYAAGPSVVHSAAKTVLAKLRPDLKAVEHSGEVGVTAQMSEDLFRQAAREELRSNREPESA